MRPDAFFELVEIRTKSASLLPWLTGTLYAAWRFGQFDPLNAFLMAAALFCLDLAVTALNHRSEAERSRTFSLNGREYAAAGVGRLIALLLLAAILAGSFLAWRTGPITWLLGSASFLAGILYSAGPLPIQRTPLGEVVSSLFMGFVIVFLACHVHLEDSFRAYVFAERFTLELNWRHLFMLVLLSLPLMTAIFDLMLANNICDMEEDLKARRYTLPVFIGLHKATALFALMYRIGAGAGLLAILSGVLPLSALLLVPAYHKTFANARRFAAGPDKRTTFPLAVASLNWIGAALVSALAVGLIFRL